MLFRQWPRAVNRKAWELLLRPCDLEHIEGATRSHVNTTSRSFFKKDSEEDISEIASLQEHFQTKMTYVSDPKFGRLPFPS